MKEFERPEIEVTCFAVENILNASFGDIEETGPGLPNELPKA